MIRNLLFLKSIGTKVILPSVMLRTFVQLCIIYRIKIELMVDIVAHGIYNISKRYISIRYIKSSDLHEQIPLQYDK